MLHEFILQHRHSAPCRARRLRRRAAHAPAEPAEMETAATLHGGELLAHGYTIAQVVHDYGDVCQAITELALDLDVPIRTREFQILNQCLDDSIADAVTEYSRQREVAVSGTEFKRQGFFAHELRNHLNTATLAFQAVKTGRVGVTGNTVAVLGRSLRSLRELIDRSVSQVRMAAGKAHKERLPLATFIEEMEIDAAMGASERGLQLTVDRVDRGLTVEVDRHLFASAISNLLQNAIKFTRPSGHIRLRTRTTADRVFIDVEDQCGGLPPGTAEAVFQPFERRSANHSGLGLGLVISRQAIEADGGTLSVHDLPGRGCVFTVELPLAVGAPVLVGE